MKEFNLEDFAEGGRVPFIFGGGAIKTAFGRLKDLKKMKHGEKMLKKNPGIQHLLSIGDKQTLKGLETQFSEQLLKMLKKDRELMLQLQSNKAMKDEGLDFLMKKMQEDFAPHIKKYKSIEEIDAAILNMESIIKNRAMKEGRKLNATGGRVPLAGGKKVLEGLAWLANKIAPKSTKIGQTSKTMAEKTQLKQAIAGFQERRKASELKEMIRKKYKGVVDEKLLNQMLVDDNPQRLAEVMATVDEALIMQGKGMGPETIMKSFKDSWKRKKQASGGVAGMLGE
jgi:hypothetical protein